MRKRVKLGILILTLLTSIIGQTLGIFGAVFGTNTSSINSRKGIAATVGVIRDGDVVLFARHPDLF